jgi:DNA-binding MarR family transcriptional regulator
VFHAAADQEAPIDPIGLIEPIGQAEPISQMDPLDPVDLDLASLAVRLMDRTKQDIREVGDEQGLSMAQLDVLRRLLANGPTPMSPLAERMNCEASNLTGLVDRLEVRGLVERRLDPDDRRVRVLALTRAGEELALGTWAAVAKRCPLNNLAPDKRAILDDLLREAMFATWPTAHTSDAGSVAEPATR